MKILSALIALTVPVSAFAHLTWIEAGQANLSLSTGHNFPAKEIAVKGQYVESVRCVALQGEAFELKFDKKSTRYPYPDNTQNCVARLKTSLIELSTAQGVAHLEENKVDTLLVDKARRSKTFQEEYFKLSQIKPIEIGSPLYNSELAQFVHKPGDTDNIFLYRNGAPLAGVSVGLEYPETPITLWSNTDTDGKVKLLLQPKSKALLRTLISEESGNGFKSQFLSVTLNPR